MENTKQVQFQDDQASFFLASGESYVGPFRASEIYAKLQSKEVSWVDHCYREKEGKWMRISEHPVFQSLQPEPPKPKPVIASAPPPPPLKAKAPEVKWFLFQNETQTGPYAAAELKRLLGLHQISTQSFVWQESFSEWKPISEVPEFKLDAQVPQPSVPSKPEDRRASPRKPLVAQIYLTNQTDVILAMCRDVSVGGMQVLTDHIPGKPGDKIQLNVLPPPSTGLKPFVAEGVLVRILEDQRGFSFRFTQISSEARKAIESYVE